MTDALNDHDAVWKGPSWDFFYHAVFNKRPISIITARGHSAETIRAGIEILVQKNILPYSPNYLSIYAVSHPETQRGLGDENLNMPVAKLKHTAIINSIETAMQVYGKNPAHRFGMSDDDPENIKLGTQALIEMKKKYPKNSFYMISTHEQNLVKKEVHADAVTVTFECEMSGKAGQMGLFKEEARPY